MKLKNILLLAIICLFMTTCKKDKSDEPTTTDPIPTSDNLFTSFQVLQLAQEEMIKIGDSLNITPLEALYYTELFLQNVPDVVQAFRVDTSHLEIITTGGYSTSISIDIKGPNGLSLYRGGAGSGAYSKLTASALGSCSNKITNKKVLLYAAYQRDFFDVATNEFQTRVVDAIEGGDVDVEVTTFKDEQCTIDLISTFNQYGLVILDTHGEFNGIFTGIRFTLDSTEIPNSVGEYLTVLATYLGGQQYVPMVADKKLSLNDVFEYDPNLFIQQIWDNYKARLDRHYSVVLTSKGVREMVPDLSETVLFSNACYSGFSATTFNGYGTSIIDVDPIKGAWMTRNPRTLYAYEANNGISYKTNDPDFCKPNEDTLIYSLFHHGDSTGNAHLFNGTNFSEFPWSRDLWQFGNNGPLQFRQYASPEWCYGECGDTITDMRDQQKYPTVCIGSQVWMAKNLNWAGAGVCFNSSTSYCNTYGRLYTWNELTGGVASATNPSGVQGICPQGWHVPSQAEWQQLIDYAGGDIIAGDKLRANSPLWGTIPGTDDFGFAALPGGKCQIDSSSVIDCFNDGDEAHMWTASTVIGEPQFILLTGGYAGTFSQPFSYTDYSSCRCVKD